MGSFNVDYCIRAANILLLAGYSVSGWACENDSVGFPTQSCKCHIGNKGRSQFFHLAMRRGRKIAKVAMARKLAVELYWMWRRGWDYNEMQQLGSHAGAPGNPHGVQ